MSPSAPWLCLDCLWHRDQNCQCFLSQQWQNTVAVASCVPGEVLVMLGHVRGCKFCVSSSQQEGTFAGHKGSLLPGWEAAAVTSLAVPTPEWRVIQHHSEACNQQLGVELRQSGSTPESSLKVLMNNECRTW